MGLAAVVSVWALGHSALKKTSTRAAFVLASEISLNTLMLFLLKVAHIPMSGKPRLGVKAEPFDGAHERAPWVASVIRKDQRVLAIAGCFLYAAGIPVVLLLVSWRFAGLRAEDVISRRIGALFSTCRDGCWISNDLEFGADAQTRLLCQLTGVHLPGDGMEQEGALLLTRPPGPQHLALHHCEQVSSVAPYRFMPANKSQILVSLWLMIIPLAGVASPGTSDDSDMATLAHFWRAHPDLRMANVLLPSNETVERVCARAPVPAVGNYFARAPRPFWKKGAEVSLSAYSGATAAGPDVNGGGARGEEELDPAAERMKGQGRCQDCLCCVR
ncbi:hypothetical protein BDK51DRAFT_48813 [Blyttiomyces helicus]|uniref:Uncharacterized protein n=1 Tax=Blyttiomyces helicus TaxID=388810 RepID=A0A4P9W0L4_9FUNG|nr:hypothetical protein BDK51DRAFT_48813 [Blyttiomyces helicus]|eukprot:RKO84653.1 hypothetical protein BDK51DRAFT_48813 [Blyttiomyces helicus]